MEQNLLFALQGIIFDLRCQNYLYYSKFHKMLINIWGSLVLIRLLKGKNYCQRLAEQKPYKHAKFRNLYEYRIHKHGR